MNKQIKTGSLILGSAVVMTAGLYVSIVPLTVAHLVVAVLMGAMGYVSLKAGETVSSIGIFALSGLFLTLVFSSVTPFSFYPVSVLLLVVGVVGAIHNIVTGIRR